MTIKITRKTDYYAVEKDGKYAEVDIALGRAIIQALKLVTSLLQNANLK